MDAQSVALLSDEGVPALSDLSRMQPAALLWSGGMRERALRADRTGKTGTVQPRRVGIGVASVVSEACVNERALPPAAMGQFVRVYFT